MFRVVFFQFIQNVPSFLSEKKIHAEQKEAMTAIPKF